MLVLAEELESTRDAGINRCSWHPPRLRREAANIVTRQMSCARLSQIWDPLIWVFDGVRGWGCSGDPRKISLSTTRTISSLWQLVRVITL